MLSLCGFHPLYEKKHFFFLSGCVFKFCLGWFSNAMGLTVILCHFSSCNHLLLWPFFFSRWKKYEFRQWILAYSTSLHEGCTVVSWGNTESALLAKCRICLLLKCRICLHCVLLFNARQAGFFFLHVCSLINGHTILVVLVIWPKCFSAVCIVCWIWAFCVVL